MDRTLGWISAERAAAPPGTSDTTFRVYGLGFMVECLWFMVYGLGFSTENGASFVSRIPIPT